MNKFKNIDEYIFQYPKHIQIILQEMREIIHEAAPEAEEVISYSMPAFKMQDVLVYFAANKNHLGFYPTSTPIIIFKDKLSEYKTSKGAIQFPLDKPIPKELVQEIVTYRINQVKIKYIK